MCKFVHFLSFRLFLKQKKKTTTFRCSGSQFFVQIYSDSFLSKRSRMSHSALDPPHIRAKQEEDVVEVATICKGKTPKQLANLRRLVSSMLDQSAGSKIRLTVLSDPDSWQPAQAVLRDTIGHYYAKGENLPFMLFVKNVDQYSTHKTTATN